MAVTVITAPYGSADYTDAGATVYLEKREASRTGTRRQTVDTWGGATAAIKEYYEILGENTMVESMTVSQNGASSTLTVTWPVDIFTGETPQDDGIDETDADQWSATPIEIPTALAAHPYFQTGYIPEAGATIEEGLAEADLAISNGEPFVADGAYKEWTSRYYALRMAGVEEWPQLGIQVSRSYNTTDIAALVASISTVGQVVATAVIGMPAGLLDAVAAINKIDSYTSSDPTSYVLTPNALEWLHRMPDVTINKIGATDRFAVKETWWGVWKWSAVLYPGGSWDPQGEVTA